MSQRPGAPSDAERPPGPYAWHVVALLSAAYLLSFTDRVLLSLLIAPIQQDLAISDTEMGLLVGLSFILFYTLFGLPIGRLVDVWSRKCIIIIGIVTWSLATSACGLAQSYSHLFAMRTLVGIGEATLSPSAYSMIADLFPPNRLSLAMGIYNLGLFLGAGLALIVGGSILAIVGEAGTVASVFGELRPWQVVFIVAGLPGLVLAGLLLLVREPARRSVAAVRRRASIAEVGQVLKANARTFGMLVGALTLGSLFGYGLAAWAPTFLIRSHDLGGGSAGLAYGSVLLVTGVGGVVAGGWWNDRHERKGRQQAKLRSLALGYALMLPGALAAPLMPTAGLALLCLGFTNFWYSFPVGGAIAALQLICPAPMRGQLSALYLLVVNVVGLGLGPLLVALGTDRLFGDPDALGSSLALLAMASLPLAAALAASCLGTFTASVEYARTWAARN